MNPPLIISDFDDIIRKQPIDGSYGGIRVQKVRKLYGAERVNGIFVLTEKLCLKELKEISEICHTWINEDEVMPFRKVFHEEQVFFVPDLNTSTDVYCKYLDNNNIHHSSYLDYVWVDVEKSEWDYKICVKRGNRPYVRKIKEKFKPLMDWCKTKEAEEKIGFSTVINKNRKRIRKGRLFFITLTIDPHKIKTPGESWLKSGKLLNSYLTYLRQEFPGIQFFTAPQAQGNGYYHPHIIAYLPNQKFTVFPNKEYNKRKKKWEYVWRIHNRVKHNDKFVRDIFKSWNYGFSDVRAIDSLESGLTEILKYVTRDLTGGEERLTLGALWFFGKQGYSMSRNFIECLTGGDIDLAEPSNDDSIKAEGAIQSNDSKSKLIRLEFFPPVLKKNLDFSYQKDVLDLSVSPDPPPKVVDYFNYLESKCEPSKFSVNDSGVEIIIYKYKRS